MAYEGNGLVALIYFNQWPLISGHQAPYLLSALLSVLSASQTSHMQHFSFMPPKTQVQVTKHKLQYTSRYVTSEP